MIQSSGPIQKACAPEPELVRPTPVGKAKPRTGSTARATSGPPRRPTLALNGRSSMRSCAPLVDGRAFRFRCVVPAMRSAIQAGPFRIDEDGRGHFDLHGAVAVAHPQMLAMALPAAGQ